MHVLANRSPLVSIYSCDKGGIHLVIRNVNIGMSPSEFCGLSNDINDALTRVESGHWPSPYLSLTYLTTVLCLSINDLPDLAATMQEATAGIASTPELIDSLVREEKSEGNTVAIDMTPGRKFMSAFSMYMGVGLGLKYKADMINMLDEIVCENY